MTTSKLTSEVHSEETKKLKQALKTFKVDPEIHELVTFYCLMNNLKKNEYVNNVLKKELLAFKGKLAELKKLR